MSKNAELGLKEFYSTPTAEFRLNHSALVPENYRYRGREPHVAAVVPETVLDGANLLAGSKLVPKYAKYRIECVGVISKIATA